jgi:nucleotide-binding universal stress UspA family protein
MGGQNKVKILLTTDGSEYSEGAAKFLTNLDLSSEDEISVFHSVFWSPSLYPTHVWFSQKLYDKDYDEASYYNALKQIKKEIAPRILDSALRILKPVNAKISTAIVEGCSPEECIVDAAVNSDMDMIVIGARGIRGIKSFFIGSVTREVSIKSPKPVLVVKLPLHARPDSIKVLFATDGSDYSRDTGEFLSKIPFHDDTQISIMNVRPYDMMEIPQTFSPEIIERIIELEDKIAAARLIESKRILEDAREQLRKGFSNINVLSAIGNPTQEILKTAEELEASLIAVGCRGLRGIKGIMGSVSRNILTHSECSVLIGKTFDILPA